MNTIINEISKSNKVDEDEVRHCMEWLELFTLSNKRPYNRCSSYRFKHIVERWCGEYISNESFIEATLNAGYKIYPIKDSPNVKIGLKFIDGNYWLRV